MNAASVKEVAGSGERIEPLRDFVARMTRLVDRSGEESELLARGRELLAELVSRDDWLPEACAQPHPQYYQQYLLHCDPLERFSVVSFVWGPGQQTPVHDHTVWGLIGVLRGAERCQRYAPAGGGAMREQGDEQLLERGDVDAVSPTVGDVHRVANAFADRVSISIHVYGANIGAVARHVFDPACGEAKPFVSGYSSEFTPNLWDRSSAVRSSLQRQQT